MGKGELTARFKQFCMELTEKDRIAIIHHSDADGFCSALIAAKAVEKLTGNKPVVVQHFEYGNVEQGKKGLESMRKHKANKLIIVDIGIDRAPQGAGEVCPLEQCLVIDHHEMINDLNSEKTVFLKAQFFTKRDPSSYVTSKFAFDLFNRVIDVSELDWLACIGIIGDMSLGKWQNFIKKTIEKREISIEWLYNFADLIAAVEVLAEKRMKELFWLFYNAKQPEKILGSRFKQYLKEFKREKDGLVEGFEEKAEHLPELQLYFYAIKAKHEGIKSYVINEISKMHPGKTIILLQELGGKRLRFSGRRQDGKVKVNQLLMKAVKDIEGGSAGGHAPAAAGSIPKKFAEQFKKNVVEILKQKYGK